MSNTKLIWIIAAVAVAGSYWLNQQSFTGESGEPDLLQRVPADTLFFFGGVENIPYFNPYDSEIAKELQASSKDQIEQFTELYDADQSPAAQMLTSLYLEAAAHFYSKPSAELNDFTFYGLGVYPVIAWKSNDIQAFTDKLEAIETENYITSRNFALGNASLREYLIDSNTSIRMYISTNGNVVSVGALSNHEGLLKQFAGVDIPAQNLSNTDKLRQLTDRHRFLSFASGYFDIHEGLKKLTSKDDNLLKQTLTEINDDISLSDLSNDACLADATSIASRWPRIVFGLRNYDIENNHLSAEATLVFEHTGGEFLTALKTIVGSLPTFSPGEDLISIGLGIDVDNIATFLANLRADITAETYQCKGLIEMQQKAAQNDPAMIAMGAQMVAGVQGVAVHLTDLDTTAMQAGDMTSIEGMAVISAKNPQNLIMVASNFYPPLAQQNPEPNGARPLITLPMGVSAKIGLADQAITLQFGNSDSIEKRILKIHQGMDLTPGIFRSGMDFSAYFKKIQPLLTEAVSKATPEEAEKINAMIKMFESVDMNFVYDLNVEENGIAFNSKVEMQNTAKQN